MAADGALRLHDEPISVDADARGGSHSAPSRSSTTRSQSALRAAPSRSRCTVTTRARRPSPLAAVVAPVAAQTDDERRRLGQQRMAMKAGVAEAEAGRRSGRCSTRRCKRRCRPRMAMTARRREANGRAKATIHRRRRRLLAGCRPRRPRRRRRRMRSGPRSAAARHRVSAKAGRRSAGDPGRRARPRSDAGGSRRPADRDCGAAPPSRAAQRRA